MNILRAYTRKSLLANRTRTIVTVIGIIHGIISIPRTARAKLNDLFRNNARANPIRN